MRLELRNVIICEACGKPWDEHTEDCPRGQIIKLCEEFLNLRCPVCHEQKVEVNGDDWLECEACHTQYSTGTATPYDVETLPEKTIIDDVRNKVWHVVQFPDKGNGKIKLRMVIRILEKLERKAKRERPVLAQLEELRERLDCTIRRSQRNVPHLLHKVEKTTYSVTYFGRTGNFRVFWPWPSFDGQSKRDFRSVNEVVEFFREV